VGEIAASVASSGGKIWERASWRKLISSEVIHLMSVRAAIRIIARLMLSILEKIWIFFYGP
jgi:hypothetical protein